MKIVDIENNVYSISKTNIESIIEAIMNLQNLETLKYVGKEVQLYTLNNIKNRKERLKETLLQIFNYPYRKFDIKNPIDYFSVG